MKDFLILSIKIYQIFISSFLRQIVGVKNACRFDQSCSEYAIENIKTKGVIVGMYNSIIRLFKCQPFYKTI